VTGDAGQDPAGSVKAPLEDPARTLTAPFRDLVSAQSGSAWVLMAALVAAVTLANSSFAPSYFGLLHAEFGLSLAGRSIAMSLQHWVNDGLMALFFFLLGLELKRELLVGRLSEMSQATSVLCAATGGMLFPALAYLAFAGSPELRPGWAIPVATDTAFALMVLVLLGERVPAAARAFLVGLAIVDDVGAILVIAFAYTSEINAGHLLPAAATVAVLAGMNLAGVRSGIPYLVAGIVLWWLFLQIGLHGTLAGVVVAAIAPVRPALDRPAFLDLLRSKLRRFEEKHDDDSDSILEQPEQQQIAHDVLRVAEKASAPLNRWETRLQKPISFIVMPLFAFLNSGVIISAGEIRATLDSALSTAIFAGLVVAKPLGILAGIRIGSLIGIAALPESLSWRHVFGIGLLGGIGFTMSLFITNLSFEEGSALLGIAKQTIIASSLCAGVAGYAWLRWS